LKRILSVTLWLRLEVIEVTQHNPDASSFPLTEPCHAVQQRC